MTWENRGDLPVLGSVSTRLASFVPSNGRSHNSSGSALAARSYISRQHISGQGQDDRIHGKNKSIGSLASLSATDRTDRSIPIRDENATFDRPIFVFIFVRCISHRYPIYFTFITFYALETLLPTSYHISDI